LVLVVLLSRHAFAWAIFHPDSHRLSIVCIVVVYSGSNRTLNSCGIHSRELLSFRLPRTLVQFLLADLLSTWLSLHSCKLNCLDRVASFQSTLRSSSSCSIDWLGKALLSILHCSFTNWLCSNHRSSFHVACCPLDWPPTDSSCCSYVR
jgi:hypothetical protein